MKQILLMTTLITLALPLAAYDQTKMDTLINNFEFLDKEKILAEKEEFIKLINEFISQPESCYILVDKSHFLSENFTPEKEIRLIDYPYDFTLSRDSLSLDEFVIPHLKKMLKAAADEGILIQVSSSYRSYEYQKNLYQYWVDKDGQEAADLYSARPGSSQHQLGTTVDFGSIDDSFAGTAGGKWLFKHADEYGFSLSYPENGLEITGYQYESWHYRYIGVAGTKLQKQYFYDSQQRLLEFIDRLLEPLSKL